MHLRPSLTIFAAFIALPVFLPVGLFAADRRVDPIDAYILLDRSPSMSASVEKAAEWLCSSFVDPVLAGGDHVSVWSFSDGASLIADADIGGDQSKDALKQSIRAVSSDSGRPDFPAAIRLASRAEAGRTDRTRMAVVLVASALTLATDADDYAGDAGTASLLRYSRVEDFAGWKLVTIGLGLDETVKAAAARFMAVADGSLP